MEQQQAAGAYDPMLVCCLDVLRGASALVARHKVELAGLLAGGGPQTRGVVERLVGDLTEALCGAGGARSNGSDGEEEQQAGREASGVEAMALETEVEERSGWADASGVKRAKGQQAAQGGSDVQQQAAMSAPAVISCARAEALGLAEVVEHVMSFVEGRELLGRLNRVCRLWRRVSEEETLCLPVVQQVMPAALLREERKNERSLHEILGGSARRCLLVHNASMTSRRLMGGEARLPRDVTCLVEISYGDKVLDSVHGSGFIDPQDDGMDLLAGGGKLVADEFIPASLGIHNMHHIFMWGWLRARVCVMDVRTGVTACLFQGKLTPTEESPVVDVDGRLIYVTKPEPVTSMTYSGPPLQAKLVFDIVPCEEPDEEELATIHLQTQRPWSFGTYLTLSLVGQPAIHGERFIRMRLAEEAMAIKQQGSRW